MRRVVLARAVACAMGASVRAPLVVPHVRTLTTFTSPPRAPPSSSSSSTASGLGWAVGGAAALAAATAATAATVQHVAHADKPKALPVYTRAQVAEHATPATGIWVTYKDGVYDISGASHARACMPHAIRAARAPAPHRRGFHYPAVCVGRRSELYDTLPLVSRALNG
jgi:hypothetical protein